MIPLNKNIDWFFSLLLRGSGKMPTEKWEREQEREREKELPSLFLSQESSPDIIVILMPSGVS